MGKSSVTLAYLDGLYMAGESKPTLILGPKRVARSTWTNEAAKWSDFRGLDIVPIMGTEKERLRALRYDVPIYTINYESLVWLIDHFGDRWPFGTVVLDEATRCKGHRISFREGRARKDGTVGKEFLAGQGTKRAGALAKIAHTHVDRLVELTGTPAPNGLIDLWGQVWFLDRGVRLGRTFDAFKKRWFRPADNGFGSVPLPHAEEQIHDAVKDVCLTIDPKDWLKLDEPMVTNVTVELPPSARTLYKEMEKNFFIQIEQHSAEAFNAAAKSQKLMQLAAGACYVDPTVDDDSNPRSKEWKLVHDEKLDALESIIEESAGENMLVVYEFRSDLARLLKRFPQGKALTAGTEQAFREGKLPLLFIHPKAAGHGIDGWQNHCHTIVFFSVSWNLEDRLQVVERVGPVRQMQANTGKVCQIYNILAEKTIDELVLERIDTKREVQDILLEACKRKNTGV
jgi:SNF2 family DNA or RNA helicase